MEIKMDINLCNLKQPATCKHIHNVLDLQICVGLQPKCSYCETYVLVPKNKRYLDNIKTMLKNNPQKNKVSAIKEYRSIFSVDLLTAKNKIDEIIEELRCLKS